MTKLRARDLGIPFEGTPGTCNAITDVPGVTVGYALGGAVILFLVSKAWEAANRPERPRIVGKKCTKCTWKGTVEASTNVCPKCQGELRGAATGPKTK